MITIFTFGIDPYSLRQLSRDITPQLSSFFEVDKEEINFFGNEGLFVHEGIEQNTWYVFIKVVLPRKLQIFQKEAEKIITNFFKFVTIHIEIIFEYYLSEERSVFINSDYPKYLTESNTVDIEDEAAEEDYQDIYTGDAFESIRGKLEE